MFVDELTITAQAGTGGDGVERWRREKYIPKGGPSGGDGGKGGDVYIEAVKDAALLSKYTGDTHFEAENGEPGGNKSLHGHGGEDLIIKLPVNSRITDTEREKVYELNEVGQRIKVLNGGRGGFGNEHFKSATNQTPTETTPGLWGEEGTFQIEVTLVADVGLLGFPNAGKSTFLNACTNATSAIGAYPFTTLEPHLGELFGFILADIPGIIEGASDGKGLGHKFLRHIRRTNMLLHMIALDEVAHDPSLVLEKYQTIRTELEKFDPDLAQKEEWVVLTKTDLVDEVVVEAARAALAPHLSTQTNPEIHTIAAHVPDDQPTKNLRDALVSKLRDA